MGISSPSRGMNRDPALDKAARYLYYLRVYNPFQEDPNKFKTECSLVLFDIAAKRIHYTARLYGNSHHLAISPDGEWLALSVERYFRTSVNIY